MAASKTKRPPGDDRSKAHADKVLRAIILYGALKKSPFVFFSFFFFRTPHYRFAGDRPRPHARYPRQSDFIVYISFEIQYLHTSDLRTRVTSSTERREKLTLSNLCKRNLRKIHQSCRVSIYTGKALYLVRPRVHRTRVRQPPRRIEPEANLIAKVFSQRVYTGRTKMTLYDVQSYTCVAGVKLSCAAGDAY